MLGKRFSTAVWLILVPIGATVFALAATRPPLPLAAAERLFQTIAFHVLAPQPPADGDVVIISITEQTLAAFPYRSPIDRGFLAGVIDTLAARGARAIGLDVVLDRPTEPTKDAALRQALTRPDVPVVAISVAPDTPLSPEQRRFLAAFLAGVRTGDANLARDRFDDTVRIHVPRDPLTRQPSFPAALAQAVGVATPDQPFPIEWRRAVPGQRAGRDAPTYPAETVALLPPTWLRGKIALIGGLIPGEDEHRTLASGFGLPSFGVDIHARVLSQMLDGRAVPLVSRFRNEAIVAAVLAIAGVAIGAAWAGVLAVGALTAVGLLFAAGVLTAYAMTGTLLPIVAPLLALALSGAAARAWRGMADRRDRRTLRTLFARFVSGPVVDQIMRDRDLFMSGGRPRPLQLTATVLYADVAGFTGICESLAPEPMVAWLDTYLEAMTSLIIAHHGVVLRFVGDGILAVFGVPVPRRTEGAITEDARNAAACAIEMEQAMQRLNDGWTAQGLPVGGLRIGLHTGPMTAGSLGRGERIEFCLLGDTANVGARLEQLGRDYAGSSRRYCTIVVGEPTWERLGGRFAGQRIGAVPLRGRQATIGAWRIDSAARAVSS